MGLTLKNTTYLFTMHDNSHPWTDKIYEMLRKLADLAQKRGYVAETEYAVKDERIWYHNEKLALAHGFSGFASWYTN